MEATDSFEKFVLFLFLDMVLYLDEEAMNTI